jgi:hypothetical protein
MSCEQVDIRIFSEKVADQEQRVIASQLILSLHKQLDHHSASSYYFEYLILKTQPNPRFSDQCSKGANSASYNFANLQTEASISKKRLASVF